MINYNGAILASANVQFGQENRAFRYGDALFETIKYNGTKLLFFEDHYFRLMSSMRILRMEIPMHFSPEFLESQILETISANGGAGVPQRVRFSVFRQGGGLYTPQKHSVSYIIVAEGLANTTYQLNKTGLKIDVFRDYFVQKSLLSNLKSANSLVYILAANFAQENELDTSILLNDAKEVAETASANLFVLSGNTVLTPGLDSGCVKGIIRKNLLALLPTLGYIVIEQNFSPFELQKADEVWLTNAINGVQWVGGFRKKSFANTHAQTVIEALNDWASEKN